MFSYSTNFMCNVRKVEKYVEGEHKCIRYDVRIASTFNLRRFQYLILIKCFYGINSKVLEYLNTV